MDRINSGYSSNNLTLNDVLMNKSLGDNQSVDKAFVTQLTPNQRPSHEQKRVILDILYKIASTDSVNEMAILKGEVKFSLENMKNNLNDIRSRTFVIFNEYTDNVYGKLAYYASVYDRDNYIKGVVNYYEIINEINKVADIVANKTKNYKIYIPQYMVREPETFDSIQAKAIFFLGEDFTNSEHARVTRGTPLNGDLNAVHVLECGGAAVVPDLTHNYGRVVID